MQATQWKPSCEAVDNVKRALSRAIRSKLPCLDRLQQPSGAIGSVSETEQPDPEQLVRLQTLHWRQLDTLDWQRRAAARCVFSGQAWAQGQLIDFTGDHIQDLATGAFLEFQLLTIGVPASRNGNS